MLAQRLSIRVAPDRMQAFVALAAGSAAASAGSEAAPPEELLAELRALLASRGVIAGVHEAALQELAARATDPSLALAELEIATGVPPLAGRPARIELAFEPGLAPGRLDADGHMNFFERGLLKVTTSGQILARLVEAEAGRDGTTVDGVTLSARAGTPLKLKLGPNVALDARGVVRATRDGAVLYRPDELLDVVAEHVHRGAVDLHTGHLDMSGSLTIRGDVERLLQARASGDLEVLGSVSGGSLSAGGSIRVSGNVRGGDAGRVVAERDVAIKTCETADVSAGGTLRVQEAVNSQLRGQQVIVFGRLRGGTAVAERSLIVKEAGSAAGVVTELRAGEPLELPALDEVQRAVMLQKLRRMAERGGVRDAFGSRGLGRAKGGKLGRLDAALSAGELRERAARADRRIGLERSAVLELGLAHPGVELRIGSARANLEQIVRGVRYALDPVTGELRAERTVG